MPKVLVAPRFLRHGDNEPLGAPELLSHPSPAPVATGPHPTRDLFPFSNVGFPADASRGAQSAEKQPAARRRASE